MRRFKLLKELPDCKVGEIGLSNRRGDFILWNEGVFYIPLSIVLALPEWFEEVKEERSSYYSCCDTAHKKGESCPIHNPEPVKKLEPLCEQEMDLMNRQKEYTCAFLALKINELIKVVNSLQRT